MRKRQAVGIAAGYGTAVSAASIDVQVCVGGGSRGG